MDRSLATLLDGGRAGARRATIRSPGGSSSIRTAGTIALEVDAQRDPSPMNAGRRMSRIAVGAALENLIRKARSHGLGRGAGTSRLSRPGHGPPDRDRREGHGQETPWPSRVTNRRLFDGRPVPAEVLDRLIEADARPRRGEHPLDRRARIGWRSWRD